LATRHSLVRRPHEVNRMLLGSLLVRPVFLADCVLNGLAVRCEPPLILRRAMRGIWQGHDGAATAISILGRTSLTVTVTLIPGLRRTRPGRGTTIESL
jgi:hypothetical protein